MTCDGTHVEVGGHCFSRGACGAEGQRACTVLERVPSCDPNLKEVSGRCVHPPCGRVSERACTLLERIPSCDRGLVEGAGCHGECKGSIGTCVDLKLPLTEPTTGWAPVPPSAGDPMRGFADMHVHMFAHLAYGGALQTGAPYDPTNGVAGALAPDFGTDLDVVGALGQPVPALCVPTHPLYPHCGRNLLHGDHLGYLDDRLGTGTHDGARGFFGAPAFSSWPTWTTTTHQQVYYKWLERAWRGGMRLMTLLAINNQVACEVSRRLRGVDCKQSMPGVDAQLDAARAFQTWLDAQPGGGWFHIVETPNEAEDTIRSGKLAVVLGIEVDTLFGCKLHNTCTPESVAAEVDRYYAKGVRHIFPNHDFDGGFAGTAIFMPALNAGNELIEGRFFDTEPCPGVSDLALVGRPPGCNEKGLSPTLGPALIGKLMDKGMLIDIDHMSHRAIEETFAIAAKRGGYPLMVGHGLFTENYAAAKKRHERMRTREQLETLRQLRGVVAVMTQDEMEDEPECKHSSRSFARNLTLAVDAMQGPVAFGSDFNGMAPHVGPRYGDEACAGDSRQAALEKSKPPLAYPFTLNGFGEFSRQITGQRTFDFNTDGLAHVGLYPDLIADLMQIVKPEYIEQLMHSASAYVDAWKLAQPKPTPGSKPPAHAAPKARVGTAAPLTTPLPTPARARIAPRGSR